MRIAINGFGRIGRTFLRTLLCNNDARKNIIVSAINVGPCVDPQAVALGFYRDSLMGTYKGNVAYHDGKLIIDDYKIPIVRACTPEECRWSDYAIDWVVDCSGKFTDASEAKQHLVAGARYVLISAPAKHEDVSIIPGINNHVFDARTHKIVSLGSCTTNALIPLVHVLHDAFSIQAGCATTVHAYTNSQRLLDTGESLSRSCRAAAINIIPTSTGASKMIKKIFPSLGDVITVSAYRVPVAKVSIVDVVALVERSVTIESVCNAFNDAVNKHELKQIIGLSKDPVVSSDFNNSPFSVTVDLPLTQVTGRLVKVSGWYDNEWGYSERLVDFLRYVEK